MAAGTNKLELSRPKILRACLALSLSVFGMLASVASANATLTANAGPDQTVGTLVPIILDGSGSSDSGGATLTYYWHQTSGAHLDFVGFDRVKPIIIGANPAGTYVFTLTVSNGTTTADDTVTITVVNPSGRTLYVDGNLTADTTTYSIANRDGSGTDGLGYKTLQGAADVVLPGDVVYIRQGTYVDAFTTTNVNVMKITRSGTATNPIRFENYNAESVILRGSGSFEDRDLNQDGYADGVAHPAYRETLLECDADYIQIVGLELENSEQNCFNAKSSFLYMAECVVHDAWYEGIFFNEPAAVTHQGNVFRWCESHNNRHGSGFFEALVSSTPMFWLNNVVADCLFYKNGFEPADIKVLPTVSLTGDPEGGGNSAGAGQNKYFYDSDPTNNHGINNYVVRTIAYHNADDGFNTATDYLDLENNITIANGPNGGNGVKFYKPGKNTISRGNFAYANLHRGYEMRGIAGTPFQMYNNTTLRNWEYGIWADSTAYDLRNNCSGFNTLSDYSTSIVISGTHNWAKDGTGNSGFSGDPKLASDDFGNPVLVPGRSDPYPPGNADNIDADYPSFFLDMNWPANSDVEGKRAYVAAEIAAAFTPASGSPLIDAGVVIPGYHCPTADDDPINPADPNDPRRHWFGAAPDIGAFEFDPNSPEAPQGVRILQ